MSVLFPPKRSISVIIPTFDRPSGTKRAIESALQQTLRPLEIIVVDDGSREPFSIEGIQSDEVSLILLRHQLNQGAALARRSGVEAARGDYVAFLDSDDIWLSDKLRQQIAAVPDDPDALVAISCGWREIGPLARQTRFPISSSDLCDFASGCWHAPGSTALIPRRAFQIIGHFDGKLSRLEDFEWYLRFALAGGRIEAPRVVGALIEIGRRARMERLEYAADRIWSRYAPRLAPAPRRRLRAYLQLEKAAASRNDGNLSGTAKWLLASLLTKPRLTVALRRWWN